MVWRKDPFDHRKNNFRSQRQKRPEPIETDRKGISTSIHPQHWFHHSPTAYLAASISQQLSARVALLQGRVGAGADAKLAVSVSCHSRWNAADSQRTIEGCWMAALTPKAIATHTTQNDRITYCIVTLGDANTFRSYSNTPIHLPLLPPVLSAGILPILFGVVR